jgi:predicted transcriptional regulator
MLDTITFVDLVALSRITPESTTEKFGGLINSSFFDASNILGNLKQRGLIDFVTSFPSQSAITITDQGKQLLAEAQERAASPFDTLDMEILVQLSKGNRKLEDLSAEVNVTAKDLAVHLYKMAQQQFISYELRNGNMSVMLTEKGFLRVKEGVPKTTPEAAVHPAEHAAESAAQNSANLATAAKSEEIQNATDATAHLSQVGSGGAQPKTYDELHALEQKIVSEKKTRSTMIFALIIVIVVVLLILFAAHFI